ncbi:MAG TPA: phosphatidylserine decarboxylase, partial [Nitrospira sp.]|nr:phosphatidylserine decarboxylase [Nitrospira sp.]
MADRAVGIPIVKEGLPFVGGLAGATLLFGLAGWTIPTVVAAGFLLFTAWFFRNPSRTIPQQPNVVVSSGDGKVIAIEEEFEPRYLKEKSIRVTVFLNVFDVHVNRMPCAGTVEGVSYQPGQFLVASKPEATLHNEQNAVMLKTESGAKVLCVQVAGLI